MSLSTTDGTQGQLSGNGGVVPITAPQPSGILFPYAGAYNIFGFEILITAIQTGGIAGTLGDVMVKKFKGSAKCLNNVSSIVGIVTEEDISIDSGASTWSVTIDTLDHAFPAFNSELRVLATGETDKDIQWVAKIILVENSL